MPTRRQFIALLAAASAYAGGIGIVPAAERRTVNVAGKRARIIDVHAHCAFAEVAPLLAGTPLAREIPASQRLGPERIAAMDARGIDIQALSVNQYWWYAADKALAEKVVLLHDQSLASWCKDHWDRFVSLSSVALQFPDLAATQLERAVHELGARGASVGGHVNGEMPTGPKYDVFWAKAQSLDVDRKSVV